MIRDPSDGSVKPDLGMPISKPRPTSAENWGLKSLDRPVKQPKPAPTTEQLVEYYKVYDVGGKPKEQK